MSPPNRIPAKVANLPSTPALTPAEERQNLLKLENFLVDAAPSEDPHFYSKKWSSDREYRLGHQKIVDVVDALNRFMKRDADMSPAKLEGIFTGWISSADFSKDPLNFVVLKNLRRALRQFETADNAERASTVLTMLAPFEQSLGLMETAKEQPAVSAPPTQWHLNTLTMRFHFLDDKFRSWPSGYTLGVIPKEGFGQNQSSDFALSLGAEFGVDDLNFFSEVYYNDAKPLGALNSSDLDEPRYGATLGQAGFRLGLVEYGESYFGDRQSGPHGGVFGRKRVGLGVGLAWCQKITHPEAGGSCTPPSLQLSAFNDSDLLSGGYGPFEMGIRLLPVTTYFNLGDSGLPDSNRLPIDFFLNYHLRTPNPGNAKQTPEDVLRDNERVTDSQVVLSALTLFTGWIANNQTRKTEAAYQTQRIVSLGLERDPKTYGLTNAGTFVGGISSGSSEGLTAYRVQREMRYGRNGHSLFLGSMLGLELGFNLIGVVATPGLPSREEYLNGEVDGISNLQARSFRLGLPATLTRDALIGLGAYGAFGDLNKSIQGDGFHKVYYPSVHGGMAVLGLALILTSGDGTGTGFLNESILGNQIPNTENLEIVGSRFDYPAQSRQFYQLETGAMALSYGVSGLLEWAKDKYQYNDLKANPRGKKAKKTAGQAKSGETRVGFSTDGHSHLNLSISGTF